MPAPPGPEQRRWLPRPAPPGAAAAPVRLRGPWRLVRAMAGPGPGPSRGRSARGLQAGVSGAGAGAGGLRGGGGGTEKPFPPRRVPEVFGDGGGGAVRSLGVDC